MSEHEQMKAATRVDHADGSVTIHWDQPPASSESVALVRDTVEVEGQDGPQSKRERQTDAWYRELNDGRVELMCKTLGYRIRVSAPEHEAWEAVELFEKWTGLHIQFDRRPRRRVLPTPGQLPMTELESDGNGERILEPDDNGEN